MLVVPELPVFTADQRREISSAPRTVNAHRSLVAKLPGMNAIQVGGNPSATVLPQNLSVVAWNVERCLFPTETAAHLSGFAPQIILLSEVDHGMARTAQNHTAEIVADAMGMNYAFGVEFYELGLGDASERAFCTDSFNTRGWHGNAILSTVPFQKIAMIRLDDHGHWFSSDELNADPTQPRIGGRMALIAVLPSQAGPICVVSTHLESNANAAHRAAQFTLLMDAVNDMAPDMPVLIGGDLNTGNHMPPDFDWRDEQLFVDASERGYDWDCTPDGLTTRPSLITPHPARQMKLDWFCTRGIGCVDNKLIPALNAKGKPLSDHDAIWCQISLIL